MLIKFLFSSLKMQKCFLVHHFSEKIQGMLDFNLDQDFFVPNQKYVYVNKIDYALKIIHARPTCLIFTRPRRMGKTQFLRALNFLFDKGGEESFKKLNDILSEDDYTTLVQEQFTWPQYKVINLDFSGKSCIWETFESEVSLSIIEQSRGIDNGKDIYINEYSKIGLNDILEKELKRIRKVDNKFTVLLIDEYDQPYRSLNDLGELDNLTMFQAKLKSFYEKIKTIVSFGDSPLKKVLLIGILRLAQTSIFSGGNQFTDLSFHQNFWAAFGFTESELRKYFRKHICYYLGIETEKDSAVFDQEIRKIKSYYNGYAFHPKQNPETMVLNPISVVRYIESQISWKSFNNTLLKPESYWGQTGFIFNIFDKNPESLSLIKRFILNDNLEVRVEMSKIKNSVSIKFLNNSPLLYLLYAGYLTLKITDEMEFAILKIPNLEIRDVLIKGLYESILEYVNFINPQQKMLYAQDSEKIAKTLSYIFKEAYGIVQMRSHLKKKDGFPFENEITLDSWSILKFLLNENWLVLYQSKLQVEKNKTRQPDFVLLSKSKNPFCPVYIIDAMYLDDFTLTGMETKIKKLYAERNYQLDDENNPISDRKIIFWIGLSAKNPESHIIITQVFEKNLDGKVKEIKEMKKEFEFN